MANDKQRRQRAKKKERKKQAIRRISEDRRCSLTVAAHIYNCMPASRRKRYISKHELGE